MEIRRSYARYVFRRGTVYYFRFIVPPDLVKRIGLREIRMSLQTCYARHAQARARTLAGVGDLLFRRIRSNMKVSELDRATLREMVKRYFHKALDEYEDAMAQVSFGNLEEVQTSVRKLETIKQSTKNKLSLRQYEDVVPEVKRFAVDNALDFEPDSPDFKKIAFEIMKTQIDILDVLKHRQQADFSWEQSVMERYAVATTAPEQARMAPQQPPIPSVDEGVNFFELVDLFCDYKSNIVKKWKGRSVVEQPRRFRALKLILGDMPVRDINAKKAVWVLECLQKIPQRLDAKRFKGKSLRQLMQMENEAGLSVKSINMNMDLAHGLFKYAVQFDYADKNYFADLRIPDEERDEDKRPPFDQKDIEVIFAPENYNRFSVDAAHFWIPLLALYTGARLEELAQLHMEDVYMEGDILVLDINNKGIKRLKNKSSKRRIPVHEFLRQELRFDEFVAKVRASGQERLFSELNYVQERFGHGMSKRHSDHMRELGIEKPKSFHSYRHAFICSLRNKGIRDELIAGVTGHKQQKQSPIPKNYTPQQGMEFLMKEVVRYVDYGVGLEHLIARHCRG